MGNILIWRRYDSCLEMANVSAISIFRGSMESNLDLWMSIEPSLIVPLDRTSQLRAAVARRHYRSDTPAVQHPGKVPRISLNDPPSRLYPRVFLESLSVPCL